MEEASGSSPLSPTILTTVFVLRGQWFGRNEVYSFLSLLPTIYDILRLQFVTLCDPGVFFYVSPRGQWFGRSEEIYFFLSLNISHVRLLKVVFMVFLLLYFGKI